jgi:hypothetical protein
MQSFPLQEPRGDPTGYGRKGPPGEDDEREPVNSEPQQQSGAAPQMFSPGDGGTSGQRRKCERDFNSFLMAGLKSRRKNGFTQESSDQISGAPSGAKAPSAFMKLIGTLRPG